MKNQTNGDKIVQKSSLKSKTQSIVLIIGGITFVSIMLYFTYGNSETNSVVINQSVSEVIPIQKTPPLSTQTPPIVESNLNSNIDVISDFFNKSKNSKFSGFFHGLIGNPEIKDTVQYPSISLTEKITLSPLETELPNNSSLIEGFPFTTFGNSTLNVTNPLNTPLICKLIFHDESDKTNYAIRHFYIAPNSQFTLTGLLDGQYQIAGLSTDNSKLAFITQSFNVYERVEFGNNIEMLGKQINPIDIF